MDGLFDKSVVALICRGCGEKNLRTVGWTKSNSDTECDHCGIVFPIAKPDTTQNTTEVDRTIGGLRALLRSQVHEKPAEPEKRRLWRRG
jgi:peptide subunit release factor 1 (eRF1)